MAPNIEVVKYQNGLVPIFKRIFSDKIPMQPEWKSLRDHPELYSPTLDFAIGPFAYGDLEYGEVYNKLIEKYDELFINLLAIHNNNIKEYKYSLPLNFGDIVYFNENARAFIGIEIENTTPRKHILGGIINASALGRVGIMVAWNDKKFQAMLRELNYLYYLIKKKHFSYEPRNLLILHKDQLMDFLNEQVRISEGA